MNSLLLVFLAFTAVFAAPQGRATAKEEAQVPNPVAECVPYSYDPVLDVLSSFPPIWDTAHILSSDTEAQRKWNSTKDGIPNIAPKGTPNGDFSKVSYPDSDPDCWWTDTECVVPKLPGIPPDVFDVPEPLTLGYGFDDGPNCSHDAFYDYLKSQNQKATMFFIGSNVMDWPLQAQRALDDGHEICVHTWSHQYMTALSNEDAFAELYYTIKSIKLVLGITPTCWRPPFGDVDDRIRFIASSLGLQTILWKYDSFDWEVGAGKISAGEVDKNYDEFIGEVGRGVFDEVGGIILAHEIDNFTMSEAMKYLPKLKENFKHVVPVGVALNKTRPYVESDYYLPTFEQYISGTTVILGGPPDDGEGSSPTGLAIPRTTLAGPSSTKPVDPPVTSVALAANPSLNNESSSSNTSSNRASPVLRLGVNSVSGIWVGLLAGLLVALHL